MAGLVLALATVGIRVQAELAPADLRCAQRTNPPGIGDLNPRLCWQLQSSHQIQAGSTTSGSQDFCRISPN
jgi:hypothetical protein